MEAVDYVVIFDDTRAEKIIRAVRPDILVKGEDWQGKTVDGADFIQSYGGKVVLAKLLKGRATSATIESVRREPSNGPGIDNDKNPLVKVLRHAQSIVPPKCQR
jgi:bifunctional ADP-heptose synthase (sugar kinase/adenylyltransferase)